MKFPILQPLPLLQNVFLNNDPYKYNPQRGAYQKTDAQPERVFVFQHQPQPVYVQHQPVYVQHQPQQVYAQPQQVFYRNTQPLQYAQYQQQVVYAQPKPQQVFYAQPKPLDEPAESIAHKKLFSIVPLSESLYITEDTKKACEILYDPESKDVSSIVSPKATVSNPTSPQQQAFQQHRH